MQARNSESYVRMRQAFIESGPDESALRKVRARMAILSRTIEVVFGPTERAAKLVWGQVSDALSLGGSRLNPISAAFSEDPDGWRELAEREPTLRPILEEIQKAARDFRESREREKDKYLERLGDIGDLSYLIRQLRVPTLDSRIFEQVRPLDERIREIIREEMAPQRPTKPQPGKEKWRLAQDKLLARLANGSLPQSIRDAARAIGESYDTTRRAAKKSPILGVHFKLASARRPEAESEVSPLEELSSQADRRTRAAIERLTPKQRESANAQLRQMDRAEWSSLLQVLAQDPEAGSTGDVPLRDNADQEADWSD